MFSKATLLVAFFAAANVVAAGPPACFLAAINQQDVLNNYKLICGDNARDVQSAISNVCSNDNLDGAYAAFSDACKNKGFTVPTPDPASANSNDDSTPTNASNTAGNPTRTGAAGASSTTNAAAQLEGSILGMLVVGAGILAIV